MGEEQALMSEVEFLEADTGFLGLHPRTTDPTRRRSTSLKTALFRSIKQILGFLLPTFVQGSTYSKDAGPAHPTAWLDGMRGIAALLVFIYHLSYSTHDVYTAWIPSHKDMLRLPLIRFFYNGNLMVSIFFVVSGYALSYKPVQQMHNGEFEKLARGLGSSVFRRGVRLYAPCVASTLMVVVMLRLGVYEWTRGLATDGKRLTGHREHHPRRYEGLGEQVWAWTKAMLEFMNPFSRDGIDSMDGHLWTIKIEYQASIILYVTQLGLCQLRTLYRILILTCLITWAHHIDCWEMVLFYSGFILAELDIRRTQLAAGQPLHPKQKSFWSILYILVFICGLYLGGQPERQFEHAPGWALLYSLIPKFVKDWHRYWTGWGALLIVYSTSNHPFLQQIFTNCVSQYLGRISFSLYLVHGAVVHSLGYGLLEVFWRLIGTETHVRKEGCFVLMSVCVLIVTVWLADLFTRLVDLPSVRFAKWLEQKCIAKRQVKEEFA